MPGHMDRRDRVINDLSAALEEAVDDAMDHLLVARNGVGGEHNGVAALNIKLAVGSSG